MAGVLELLDELGELAGASLVSDLPAAVARPPEFPPMDE
jgi:hypothetical protein